MILDSTRFLSSHAILCWILQVHVLTKEIVFLGMCLLKFLPCSLVDTIVVILSKLKHGKLSAYGLQRPTTGPFYLKAKTGRSPTIDVGAIDKIRKGEIQVPVINLNPTRTTPFCYLMINNFYNVS